MEPIGQNDYYRIFQTGLLVALKELGVKQAHLAGVCGMSPGYLSKLKGWEWDEKIGALVPRSHKTNTNFRRYAVALMHYLEQEHQIRFMDGYFTTSQEKHPPRQWGDLNTPAFVNNIRSNNPGEEITALLEEFDVPEAGELMIEWTVDMSDMHNLYDIVEKIHRLATKANAQMSLSIKLRKRQKSFSSKMPSRSMVRSSPVSEERLMEAANEFKDNPYVDVRFEAGEVVPFEHIAGKNAINGLQRERFCDQSDWEALLLTGNWKRTPDQRSFQGSGIYQYVLSRYTYGTHSFNLCAILVFDGYQQHAGAANRENANAGIVLGWQTVENRSQYYHILLDGEMIRLERVGAFSGDHYTDFEYLDSGAPFKMKDGEEYQFHVQVTADHITVYIDGVNRYQVATPPGIEGRAGIRPWRAQVTCSYFEIWEETASLA